MTEAQLRRLLPYWQKVLRLQDWDVKVGLARARDMAEQNNVGQVSYNRQNKCAVVRLLHPVDYPPDTEWPQDQEATLVHELLHLHFAGFDAPDEPEPVMIAKEQILNAIAAALVGLKRSKTDGMLRVPVRSEQHEGPQSPSGPEAPESGRRRQRGEG